MSAWLEIRLARADAVARLSPAVSSLARGKLPEDAAELATRALRALEARGCDDADESSFTREALVELASKPSARRVKERGLAMAEALIEALLYVDAMPAWTVDPVDDGEPPSSITLADGRDGQLYAELGNRDEEFETLASQGGVPIVDMTGLDDEERFDVAAIAVRASSRAELVSLDRMLATLGADQAFLVDVTWGQVDPAYARPSFDRLRRLVRRALESDGMTLAWHWSV